MAKTSAGLMMFRVSSGTLELLLVHPGGPYWAKRDAGAWSIPKGEYSSGEDPLSAAIREFEEELGFRPDGDPIPVTPVKQKGGKVVAAWAIEGDCDPATIRSNTFSMEWPPNSGTIQEFPEVDRAEWFSRDSALEKINTAQRDFVNELCELLSDRIRVPEATPPPSQEPGEEQTTLFN